MATRTKVRVLIVDDEPGARRRLERLLGQAPDIEIVDQVGNGHEAVAAIRTLKPDLVFLDVQMPGMTGIEVVQVVGSRLMPVTVFVTAYDQYAVQAFDLAALDYLLKPFDDERFEQALMRAREDLGHRTTFLLLERLDALHGSGHAIDEGVRRAPHAVLGVPDEQVLAARRHRDDAWRPVVGASDPEELSGGLSIGLEHPDPAV